MRSRGRGFLVAHRKATHVPLVYADIPHTLVCTSTFVAKHLPAHFTHFRSPFLLFLPQMRTTVTPEELEELHTELRALRARVNELAGIEAVLGDRDTEIRALRETKQVLEDEIDCMRRELDALQHIEEEKTIIGLECEKLAKACEVTCTLFGSRFSVSHTHAHHTRTHPL